MKHLIEQLRNFNLDDPYSYENLILFFEINNIKIPTLTKLIPKGEIVFRSRENFDNLFFKKISELNCPPKECVLKFNRANRPYQSMFYCSDKRETSYSEFMEEWIEKPIGSIFNITIGMWETNTDLKVHLIYDLNNINKDINSVKGDEWDEDTLQINDFLVEIFKASAHNNKPLYILTSAISNILLMRSNLDGIMFPCVPTNGIGFNLVLNSNICLKKSLDLKHVLRDTFMTIKNSKKLKADHKNVASIDGIISCENELINWS
jgi:hypothetical protein